jgi:hypothetical protein
MRCDIGNVFYAILEMYFNKYMCVCSGFRLEILRELLPHGDQKRDKASFLLEVNRSPTF